MFKIGRTIKKVWRDKHVRQTVKRVGRGVAIDKIGRSVGAKTQSNLVNRLRDLRHKLPTAGKRVRRTLASFRPSTSVYVAPAAAGNSAVALRRSSLSQMTGGV